MTSTAKPPETSGPTNFIKQIVEADLASGKNNGRVVTFKCSGQLRDKING